MIRLKLKRLFSQKILILLFGLFVLTNLIFSAWYVINGDILFSADIARDFHLFREIDEKKIILIGPRSSVSGLFHGPVWLYFNYPAYLLGKGNPIVVGWYWVFLTILFLITSFVIAKKLFGRTTAYFYVLLLSEYAVFHTKGLFNPHGVYFLLPLFYFLLIRYLKTKRVSYLISHLVAASLLIQFELAIGIPYLILSSSLIVYFTFKNKTKTHLLALLVIPLCLLNFIAFDFRHDFLLSKSVGFFLKAHERERQIPYLSIAKDNLRLIFTGVEILRDNPLGEKLNLRLLIAIIFAFLIWRQVKENHHKREYLVFLYFYLGYFLISFVNKGFVLYFYHYPQFSLVFLAFASFITSNYRKIFIPIFLAVLAINFQTAIKNTRDTKLYIGKEADSWKFLFNLSKKVYQQPENSFGYFIFSPDTFAYQPKYAMLYTGSLFDEQTFSFEKKPVTYIIAAPHPFIKDKWWRENRVNIKGEPENTINFENGYKIEKYLLSGEEVKIPFDPTINPGILFR